MLTANRNLALGIQQTAPFIGLGSAEFAMATQRMMQKLLTSMIHCSSLNMKIVPDFNTADPDALSAWHDTVRRLRPRQVMVYTIDRETPDKSLAKYTVEEMAQFVKPLVEEGFDVQIRG